MMASNRLLVGIIVNLFYFIAFSHVATAGGTACGNNCNLTAHEWVFILGTGRSGSTTVLEMINELPNVELSGEHDGELFSFMDLRERMKHTLEHNGDAWLQEINALKENELFCMMQRWFFLHTGKVCSRSTIHGFKEVRYNTFEQLDFIGDAFPNAKIVMSYRRDLEKQSNSSWFKDTENSHDALFFQTRKLVKWAEAHPTRSYLMPLEDFSAGNFTALYRWLGFTHCEALAVTHANNGAETDGYHHGSNDLVPGKIVSCK